MASNGGVSTVSTVQAVADALRSRVLDGEFPPGTQLREVALLEDYSVARHCIRSALHALSQEGLLRHLPNRGVFVPGDDPGEFADVLLAREALEREAIRQIVERRLPIDPVEEALARLEALPADAPWSELIAADLDVHRAIVAVVGSPRMTRLHDGLLDEARLFLAFFGDKPGQREAIPRDHPRLVRALQRRDAERAMALLAADLPTGRT